MLFIVTVSVKIKVFLLWGHIISFWGHIISFWGRYPYWGQGSIGGKIIILWGDFELGARLLTYGGILLTFGGVIINNMFDSILISPSFSTYIAIKFN